MKKLLVLCFALLSSAAAAQNVTCPTRPFGDNSNACADTAFVQSAVAPIIGSAITGLTGDVSATGPGNVPATIQPGVVTSAKMATGAAATNVGTLGGQLTGTLPSPNIAAGTVTNSNLANMNADTIKANVTGSATAPQDATVTQLLGIFGGPAPVTGFAGAPLFGAQGSFWADVNDADGNQNARIHAFRDRVFVDDGVLDTALANSSPSIANSRSGTAINSVQWNWGPFGASLLAISSWGRQAVVGQSVASMAGRTGDPVLPNIVDISTIGVAGFGLNDNTTSNQYIAWGGYFEALRKTSTVGNAYGTEVDVGTTSVVDGNVNNIFPSTGVSLGSLIACGGSSSPAVTYTNCTAGLAINNNGAKFRKGVVIAAAALDTTQGSGGGGLAMQLPRGASLQWLNAANGIDAEMWAIPGGFQITTPEIALNTGSGSSTLIVADTSGDLEVTSGAIGGKSYFAIPVAIASLPTCTSSVVGGVMWVNNGISAPTFHQAVSTTGAGTWPVACTTSNGSSFAWVYD